MAGKRKAPAAAKKAAEPELVFDDGYWWMVSGTKRVNAGRSRRYAERFMAEQQAQK